MNVNQALVRPLLKGLAGVLVHVRRSQHGPSLDPGNGDVIGKGTRWMVGADNNWVSIVQEALVSNQPLSNPSAFVLLLCWKRHWTRNTRPRLLSGLDNLVSRVLNEIHPIRLELDADDAVGGCLVLCSRHVLFCVRRKFFSGRRRLHSPSRSRGWSVFLYMPRKAAGADSRPHGWAPDGPSGPNGQGWCPQTVCEVTIHIYRARHPIKPAHIASYPPSKPKSCWDRAGFGRGFWCVWTPFLSTVENCCRGRAVPKAPPPSGRPRAMLE